MIASRSIVSDSTIGNFSIASTESATAGANASLRRRRGCGPAWPIDGCRGCGARSWRAAGVGVSWYTWLEQGRGITVSAEVLDAIGAALRLSGPERTHLYLLAGINPPPPGSTRDAEVSPQLRRLLDA